MPQELPIYQVDAFASEVFAGNPAAVCPLEAWLPDPVMQAIAMENNLAETAFFVARDGSYDLRWFTPALEVDLCGHATLGSGYVIATYLDPGAEEMTFSSRSGPLKVTRSGDLYTLDFPALSARQLDLATLSGALGRAPAEAWCADKNMAVLESEAAVRELAPDLAEVAALEGDGLIVTAPGDACDFVSRYFAPHAGIPEDPVTGSAHCVLTPYWAERLGKTTMRARQISKRGGDLEVALEGERVLISGRVVPYLEGRIYI